MEKVIEVKNLTKEYKNKKAINNLSFDVYKGENLDAGKKSIAYSLTFSDPTKTLSDEEVMKVFNKIIEDVTKKHNAVLRDK